MNTGKTNTTAAETKLPDFVRRIGKTTYKVNVHFSTASKETVSDKTIRMLLMPENHCCFL